MPYPEDLELEATLEEMIDASSVSEVLEAIVQVMASKAAHIGESWQDYGLQDDWEKAANVVQRAALNNFVERISD
jgi:hypothetical protein